MHINWYEHQHKYYTKSDEFARYNELLSDMTCKYIFIRFNPDKYKQHGNIYNTSMSSRLNMLDKEINTQIDRITQNKNIELLEIIHLFYDDD